MSVDNVVNRIKNLKNFEDYDTEQMIKDAETIAEAAHKNGAKTNQIRKIHTHITKIYSAVSSRKIENNNIPQDIKDEILFIKPLIAYNTVRNSNLSDLKRVLDPSIDKIKTLDSFEKFKKFYDSIVAYFKYFEENKGGKR
ncbi:type III-A CRISPR-associated protein Csm2 [Marinitoga litoralis]|uniref:type III-A CRISPR-associated protein Csm2 n=1 Tax=Marinitoga litoralis TaxID=570855 RepID=UPI001960450B|nr:type III-A CRISPR-associated protein Csm2 [Marinitoga litoralis]MBM7558355.1 CRISPR type III-A-associated protein Csm2 [Marinitoga litoralis]